MNLPKAVKLGHGQHDHNATRRWTVVYEEGDWVCGGECDYGERKIRIDPRTNKATQIETILHEMLHAEFPWMEDPFVQASAKRMAKALVDTGAVLVPSEENGDGVS